VTVLLLARFTLREATRKKAVMGGLVLTAAFLLLYAIGTYFAFREIAQQAGMPPPVKQAITGELMLAGLYFVDFIAGLLAIFSAVGTISTEIEQGTLHAIVPKPLHRWEVVIGKWLGFATMLSAYVVGTALFTILAVNVQTGHFPANAVQGIAVMVLHALLLLSLTILGTTALPTVANGIIVFMLYAVALAGGRLEQLGTLIDNQTLINIGIITSLIIPSDALWRLTSSLMGSGGFLAGSSSPQPGMFTVVDPPSTMMVAYAAIYAATALFAAVLMFRRRDL
jgi:ABC-type transport system involved in multi-copper enzyme maturation permease subunit